MLPYFLLLAISALLPHFLYRPADLLTENGYTILSRKRNRTMLFLFFFGFFTLLTLRDLTVGNDLIVYRSIFDTCKSTRFEDLTDLQWEIGYTFYSKLFLLISDDYRIFLMLTSVVSIWPIYRLYLREKNYAFLLIVLFLNMPCFLIIFSGLRQAIAISIGALAYMAVSNRKYVLSALMILLAISFHISAFILILLFPALFIKTKTKHLAYIAPVMLIVGVFRVQILELLLAFMPNQYIEFYGDVQRTGAFGMMVLFLIFCVFSFVVLDEKTMTRKDYFMRNMLLISTVIQFFVPIHGMVQRASYYFLLFVPIAIVSVVQAPRRYFKDVSRFAVAVLGCFFTVYFFFNAYFSSDNLLGVFPYKFFWSGLGW